MNDVPAAPSESMQDQSNVSFILKWGLQATRKIGNLIQGHFEEIEQPQPPQPAIPSREQLSKQNAKDYDLLQRNVF